VPAVSVVLNCYNHEAYVGEAIASVLAQSFTDFELLITDNGSTDGTRKVIESFSDPRIRLLLHDNNESLSRRLNQGVAAATGDYVCILYSDDWMLPDKLERQVAQMAALPADYGVVYCPSIGFNQHTKARWPHNYVAVDGTFMPAILRRYREGYPDISSPMFRRACFSDCHWHEDLFSDGEAIHMRIGLNWKFRYHPEPTVVLRDHGGNMGKAIQKNHDMLMAVCARMAADPAFPDAMRRDLDHFCAIVSRSSAWVALRVDSGDMAWVRKQLHEVLRYDAWAALHPRYLAALGFVLVPTGLRGGLNRIGRRLRGNRENATLVTDY
jgi:glycosyltransferase involved in cell wall biosynthesis